MTIRLQDQIQTYGGNFASSIAPRKHQLGCKVAHTKQCGYTCPYYGIPQCEESVGRALGTLGAHASLGRKSRVSLHEYPHKGLPLGRWRQGLSLCDSTLQSTADMCREHDRHCCKFPCVRAELSSGL